MSTRGSLFVLAVLFLAVPGLVIAQVPNGDFENWSGGNPDNWLTGNIPGFVTNVFQVSDVHSGQWAVRGEVVDLSGPYTPLLFSPYFPISARYTTLDGWYKLDPMGEEVISIIVVMKVHDDVIGSGYVELNTMQTSYTSFSTGITYFDSRTPDSTVISIALLDLVGDPVIGSSFNLDGLVMGTATSADDPVNSVPTGMHLFQNFPNPFNPTTSISYALPASTQVDLSVFNLLGEKVATLVNGFQSPGEHRALFNASSLPGGVYLYRLRAGAFSQSKKLVLLK